MLVHVLFPALCPFLFYFLTFWAHQIHSTQTPSLSCTCTSTCETRGKSKTTAAPASKQADLHIEMPQKEPGKTWAESISSPGRGLYCPSQEAPPNQLLRCQINTLLHPEGKRLIVEHSPQSGAIASFQESAESGRHPDRTVSSTRGHWEAELV